VVGLDPATLEFWVRFPNDRNQGKQGAPRLCQSTGFLTGPTPREQLCIRYCSNKHTRPPASSLSLSEPRGLDSEVDSEKGGGLGGGGGLTIFRVNRDDTVEGPTAPAVRPVIGGGNGSQVPAEMPGAG
jgi:hypothetical protein